MSNNPTSQNPTPSIDNLIPKIEKCTLLLENNELEVKTEDPNEKLNVFYKDMSKKGLDKRNYESKVHILFANNPLDFVVIFEKIIIFNTKNKFARNLDSIGIK